MPDSTQEIKQYIINKLQNETIEELTSIMEATLRRLPECKEEHKLVLETWVSTIQEMLQVRN